MLVLIILSLVASTILSIAMINERVRTDFFIDQQVQQQSDNWYKVSRITFCYDNDIKPCSDSVLTTWNVNHQEEQFGIVSPKF